MARLCFDYGHGGNDPGACYNGRTESNDVLNVGRKVAENIRRHGVYVDETRTEDSSVSLGARSSFENRNSYDYFISFHRNAFSPEQANGVETYIYLNPGQAATSMAEKVQGAIVNCGFQNRGVKYADFHVLRETKAPAILIELGFIDSSSDNKIFDDKQDEIVKAISKAILDELGITYNDSAQSSETISTTLYRVMAGSYSTRSNAQKQVERLKSSGFDAVIMTVNR